MSDIVNNPTSIVENEEMQTDLLEALKKIEKKHLFYQRVICTLMLILVVCVVAVLPSTLHTLKVARDTMTNANTAVLQATEAIENANIAISQAETTLKDVSEFVTVGGDGLATAMEKINGIDIDGLNDAIADLKAVVEPMARFFGKR